MYVYIQVTGATDDARAEELLARLEFEGQKEGTAKVSGPPTPATGAESPGEKKQLWPETDVTEAGAGGGVWSFVKVEIKWSPLS